MAEGELPPQIGQYTVTQLLKKSSTSSLYQGKPQGRSGRKKDIVIRVLELSLNSSEAKELFLSRAHQLKKLKHRNIVEVLDYGLITENDPDQDHGYLVMQQASTGALRLGSGDEQPRSPVELRHILSPVAQALQYAHVSNVIHGNLHPGNLLVDERGETLLADFSLPFYPATSALPYMAPEQLRGTLTSASDQYALAVLVYEWLCGRRPYEASEREELLSQQEQNTFPAPGSLNSTISPLIERILLKALAQKPEERFPSIQSFADTYLHALMGLPVDLESKPIVRQPIPQAVHIEVLSPVTTTPTIEQSNGHRALSEQPREESVEKALLLPTPPPTTAPIEKVKKRLISVSSGAVESLQKIVSDDLEQGGVLSNSLPGYEERPAQIEMARVVTQALTENAPAIIEAGTGTGKSLAYLVPIIRSGKIAIISTANKALQEQLFYKDIPFVQQHIQRFEAALVKGMANYVCLDRLESERVGMQFYAKNREFTRLLNIIEDHSSTFMGDFETLGFQLPADIRGRVAADSDQCAWAKCNYFDDCYVRMMREKAEQAQIIVVNHTLLLLDAAIGGFLLPDRDLIVLDEAHHLEEEATRSFTITINPAQITTLLAQRMLKDHSQVSLQDEASLVLMKAWTRLEQIADPGAKGRTNLQAPFEEGLKLATTISDLVDSLRRMRPRDLPEKEDQLYDKLVKRTQNLAQNIRTVFSVNQPTRFVYYVERAGVGSQRGYQLQVSAAPLDVTSWLKEKLFSKTNVICTSATLATVAPNPAKPEDKKPNFVYFRNRVGLSNPENPDEELEVLERILPLAFDYEENALLYLPRDLPEPVYGAGSDDYTKAIAREMWRLVNASRGRAFLLFSSKRMLDGAYELMAPHLTYPLLRQGDLPRVELTRRFREEEGAVLFGLKSFWEGVDIAGEALSLVVIDKLPFDPPDDPVHEARVAQMKADGENWFGTYVLPQAVLRLKQGLGRLLRTREDRGVMAILDTRLYTKGYGKMVLDALPPARRTADIKEVGRFFASPSNGGE